MNISSIDSHVNLKKESFAKLLRKIRLGKNFSIDFLAERSGLSKQAILNIESGRNLPSLYTLEQLSNALCVNLSDIYNRIHLGDSVMEWLVAHSKLLLLDKDYEALAQLENSFINSSFMSKNPLLYRQIKQNFLLFEALKHKNLFNDYDNSKDLFVQALKISNPRFKFNKIQKFNYYDFENRIVMDYALLEKKFDNLDYSAYILEHLVETTDINNPYYTDILLNLAWLYLRFGDFEASRVNQLAIDLSKKNGNFLGLAVLYYQKACIEHSLSMDTFIINLNKFTTISDLISCDALQKRIISSSIKSLNVKFDAENQVFYT